jgi:hypothetical protein
MSEKQNSWRAFSLLAGWIFASLIGWTTGLVAAGILAPVAARIPFPWHHDRDIAFAYVSLILLGITIGIAQWTVLRRYLPKATRWIAATMIGYLLCAIIFAFANNDPARLLRTEVVNNVVLFALMGIAIGASQWWVLRQHYLNARLWVLASAFGFLFFMWLVVNPAPSQGVLYLRSATIGAFAAALTGVWLVWMIRQPLAGVSHKTV